LSRTALGSATSPAVERLARWRGRRAAAVGIAEAGLVVAVRGRCYRRAMRRRQSMWVWWRARLGSAASRARAASGKVMLTERRA
jgi:hypothetical protein